MTESKLTDLLEDAFVRCRNLEAPLADRLQAFANEVRGLGPHFQTAIDALVSRLTQSNAGATAVPSENSIRYLIRAATENRGIIQCDACHPARARNIRLRSAQVPVPASSREPVSAPSTQYRLAAGTASASTAW